jgi:hypothetical protein
MKKLFTVAAFAVAISVPVGVSIAAMPGVAGAASSITCKGLTGKITGNVTISKCTPTGGAGYKTASAPAVNLATGGNITWKTSNATTTIGNAVVSNPTNKCGTKGTEYSFTGSVTAASTVGKGIPKVGDAVSALACVSSTGAITLLPRTTMKL